MKKKTVTTHTIDITMPYKTAAFGSIVWVEGEKELTLSLHDGVCSLSREQANALYEGLKEYLAPTVAAVRGGVRAGE